MELESSRGHAFLGLHLVKFFFHNSTCHIGASIEFQSALESFHRECRNQLKSFNLSPQNARNVWLTPFYALTYAKTQKCCLIWRNICTLCYIYLIIRCTQLSNLLLLHVKHIFVQGPAADIVFVETCGLTLLSTIHMACFCGLQVYVPTLLSTYNATHEVRLPCQKKTHTLGCVGH